MMASGAFQIDSGAIGSWASGERVAQDLVRAAARADPAGRAEGVPCLAQPRAVLDWSAGGGMPGAKQGVGFAGNYCKDAPQAFLGPKETLRYGRDLDLDRLCTTDRANLEKLREEAWRGRLGGRTELRPQPGR